MKRAELNVGDHVEFAYSYSPKERIVGEITRLGYWKAEILVPRRTSYGMTFLQRHSKISYNGIFKIVEEPKEEVEIEADKRPKYQLYPVGYHPPRVCGRISESEGYPSISEWGTRHCS